MKLKSQKESLVQGIPISHGIASGRLILFVHTQDLIPEIPIDEADLPAEINRYLNALIKTKQDMKRLKKQFEMDDSQEAAAILETHLQILEDPLLCDEIPNRIRTAKKNADFIFYQFLNQYNKRFEEIQDPFFRERGRDLLDISRRVLSHLRKKERSSLSLLPPGTVVFSHEIAASDVAEASPKQIAAIITDMGGATSHAALVAKAKGIPYVANVHSSQLETAFNSEVIVDGRTGEIILFPTKKTILKYMMAKDRLTQLFRDLENTCNLQAETADGYTLKLSANIEMVSEIEQLHRYGGGGVGLFRSEYIFLSKQAFPSEEEQFIIYSQIVDKMKGKPIVIRTFDVGGDKVTLEQQASHQGNPYMGCRAIRFFLKERELFKSQIRAILRASERGSVSMMFPMISELSELLETKAIIREVQKESGITRKKIRIGCMIEVPSAAMISDLLAKECDFLSIGTNDLVQYLLAVDRSCQAVNALYTPMHPAVIRTIKLVISQASAFGLPVSVCGEIAGDPRFTSLLIGLGVHELSVSIRNLPLIKKAIRHVSVVRSHKFAEEILQCKTVYEVQELLEEEYRSIMPVDFHRI